MDVELVHYALRARKAADRAARFCASAIKAAKSAERWHARAETFAANAAFERAEADYAWERVRVQFRRLGIMIPDNNPNEGNSEPEGDDEDDDDGAEAADEEIRALVTAQQPGAEEGDGETENDEDYKGPDREPKEAQQAGRRVRARRD